MAPAREILRQALALYGRERQPLLATAGLLLVPLAGVAMAASVLSRAPLSPAVPEWARMAGSGVLEVVKVLVALVTEAAVAVFVAHQLAGSPLGWREAWTRCLGRARPVLTATLAAMLPLFGLMLLLLMPATFISATMEGPAWLREAVSGGLMLVGASVLTALLVFVIPVAVLEGEGGFAAYRRNRALLAGRFWKVAAVIAPLEIAQGLAQRAAGWIFAAKPLSEGIEQVVWWLFVPLQIAASVILYARIRREAEACEPHQLVPDR